MDDTLLVLASRLILLYVDKIDLVVRRDVRLKKRNEPSKSVLWLFVRLSYC